MSAKPQLPASQPATQSSVRVLMKCHIVSQNKYTHRCLSCINNNNNDDADLHTFVLTTQLPKSNKYARASEINNYTSDFRTQGEN